MLDKYAAIAASLASPTLVVIDRCSGKPSDLNKQWFFIPGLILTMMVSTLQHAIFLRQHLAFMWGGHFFARPFGPDSEI